ncbi:glycosyltransferase family 2 protein [Limnoraphis robusta Tam1]|uniref:Glycosyltransferase family 2 protein n=1 Tax=Limnoraphis robusta CCNP1315 TaxID=3110306 RepID=A0ABU5TXT3_9CYAN|nr:glycosyltransferase family 2 protein [Limnoraphis robusta]MEA5497271.1 glycosyltransferase family 2 protein [Limnoraphis robusta BA-68 BA1]MEA5519689.1 glycosyltransferase family 2 protein [Limnoraphis robusta CCNP1315]MEA5540156.1 glycosyltransferase family 2 protein [Limnoraphis robusta Tam1]MEA5544817.1 glycosyltransferase family 2 protein [Limnoraphis robusta CCNP1324]
MISVIMAAYNASKYIGLAIESVLNQTFREFELLIVDDHSTDSTLDIIKYYADQDSRIQVLQTEQNSGASTARNVAIRAAKYPWLAIMDSDDIAQPERFEKQMNAAKEKPHVVAWGTYACHISSTGKVLSLVKQGAKTEEEFYQSWQEGHIPFVIHPSTLINREIFEKAGGYVELLENYSLTPAEDFELVARLGNFGPILVIPEPLLLYRVHSSSQSMQKFFWQKKVARYVVTRHRAKLAGNKEPLLSQFLKEYDSQAVMSRLAQQLRTLGQFWYRKAGLFFADQDYIRAGLYLGIAIAANPSYSIPRLWHQKLSPKTRMSMRE